MNQIDPNDRIAYGVIASVSVVILLFLFWLIYFKPPVASSELAYISSLPTLNALLNSLTTFLLILGFYFIKMGKRKAHISTMLTATFTSGLFLIGYIIY